MIRIEMLAAQYGDCLWVEYGAGDTHTLLIDGGLAATFEAITTRAGERSSLELLCVTHIDEDHIQGALKLLANMPPGLEIAQVWFNGYDHLKPSGRLGAKQAEELSAAIVQRAKLPWNKTFDEMAAVVSDSDPLPKYTLPGGIKLTLLSPRQSELDRLRPVWERECKRAGILPGDPEDAVQALDRDKRLRLGDHVEVEKLAATPYEADPAPANGSSIAFLAEFDGTTVLFGADAHSEVLVPAIRRLLAERKQSQLRLDACKMPHHGSKFNNSPEFIGLLDCPKWLFSTSGKRYHHPDPETIARILVARRRQGTELFFNYRSDENTVWDEGTLTEDWNYQVHYPKKGREGLIVEV